jgi:DNA-binding transcriptional regulator LsrR (DeoR family)
MNEIILAGKVLTLGLAVLYSVPVVIGGAIQKSKVSDIQATLCGAGVTGFVTLQWLL